MPMIADPPLNKLSGRVDSPGQWWWLAQAVAMRVTDPGRSVPLVPVPRPLLAPRPAVQVIAARTTKHRPQKADAAPRL
jgi:hypothetical protein